MKGKQIVFFAIFDDLYSTLCEVERDFEIEYVEMGSFDENGFIRYATFSDIPHLGYTDKGDWAASGHRFMVIPKGLTIQIREVEQEKGGIRFIIDAMKNPVNMELTVKGIYTKKANVIVAGRAALTSNDAFSTSVYKTFLSLLKKKFKKVNGVFIGPNAEAKLREGWRLVMIENSPVEKDLATFI